MKISIMPEAIPPKNDMSISESGLAALKPNAISNAYATKPRKTEVNIVSVSDA